MNTKQNIALYRKYRPTRLDNIVGQELIVKSLTNSLISNTLSHAYIFAGPPGVGKTSITQILGYSLNCDNPDDYMNPCYKCSSCLENLKGFGDIKDIDGATNRGIDSIKALKDDLSWTPRSKKKVIIIDESHMLTDAAWNALLKTIEEPPSYVIFIFATTEIDKIPATIKSRCQKFYFQPLDINQISDRLKYICYSENIIVETELCFSLIAEYCNGGLRESINYLEQSLEIINSDNQISKKLTLDNVNKTILSSGSDICNQIYTLIKKGNECDIISYFNDLKIDIKPELFDSLIRCFRLEFTTNNIPIQISNSIINTLEILIEFKNKLIYNSPAKTLLEIACLKCTILFKSSNIETINSKQKLENNDFSTISKNKIELFLSIIESMNHKLFFILSSCNITLSKDGNTLNIISDTDENKKIIFNSLKSSRAKKIKEVIDVEYFIINDIQIEWN